MAKIAAHKVVQIAQTRAEQICSGKDRLADDRVGTLILVAADQKGVCVDPSAFKAALRGTGYEDLVPDPVKPHKALTRAIGNAKKGIRDNGSQARWSRVGETMDGRLVFALSRGYPDADGRDLETEVVMTVDVSKDGVGGLVWTEKMTPHAEEAAEVARIEERYAKERGFLTLQGVRDLVNNVGLSKLRGIRLGGTVAFLLPHNVDGKLLGDDEKFLLLSSALRLANIRMTPQEVFEGQRTGYAADVRSSLLDEVAELKASCEQRLAAAKASVDPNNPKKFLWKTITERRDEAQALRDRIAFFEAFVGIVGDDLRDAVAAADRILDETMKEAASVAMSLAS